MTSTRRTWMTAGMALALAVGAAQADEALDAALREALSGTQTPAVAALEIVEGRVARQAVFGRRRSDASDAVQLSDRWLIGSNGKPLTAALVARLVDQGRLRWDQPLAELLPQLQASMHEAYRRVTLVQLLSHRAGLPENLSDMPYFDRFHTDQRPLPAQRLAYVSRALQEAPVAPPGSQFSYSNTGFMLAAVVAEKVTGKSYETLMRQEVFGPLGMTAVGFGVPPAGQPQGHTEGRPVHKPTQSNPPMFAPAGNLHMSLQSWAAFCRDQLAGARGQGGLLKADSYRRMQTVPADGGGALAWGVQASLAGRTGPVLMHAGSDGNWFALVALFPETGRGVLTVANAGPDMGGDQAAQRAMMALLPPPSPPAPASAASTPP